jgi:hypothetical protein
MKDCLVRLTLNFTAAFAYSALACLRMVTVLGRRLSREGKYMGEQTTQVPLWQPHFVHQLSESRVRVQAAENRFHFQVAEPVVLLLIGPFQTS